MASRKPFSISETHFLDLVSKIYQSGLDASRWNESLKLMTSLFQAEQSNLRTIEPDSWQVDRYYSYNRDPFWVQAFKDYYYRIEPWQDMVNDRNSTLIECSHHLLSDREYRKLEFYNDFVIPADIHYGMGGLISVQKGFNIYFAMSKSYRRGEFHRDQLQAFNKLVPHLERAILINQRTRQLELESETLRCAINRINGAVALVNNKSRLLFINDTAQHLFERNKYLSVISGYLRILDARYNQRLAELIHNATLGVPGEAAVQAGGMNIPDSNSGQNLVIMVCPLHPELVDFDLQGKSSAMVFFSKTKNSIYPVEGMLKQLYRFTEGEARVVALLCSGLTPNEISEQLQLTQNTIKTHLKAAFNKTDTRRQAELITMINTGPLGFLSRS